MKKTKVCYVLPQYSASPTTNAGHLVELIEDVGKTLDMAVFIEQSLKPPVVKNVSLIHLARCKFLPFRLLERFLVFTYFRMRGYKIFYVHFSFWSAIIAGIVRQIFGGKTFVWNCGQMKEMLRSWPEKLTFRLMLRVIDILVTCNQLMKEYYPRHFRIRSERIKVMFNWVNLERFDKNLRLRASAIRKKLNISTKNVVLFVHWLSERKGSRRIPDIVRAVLKMQPDTTFVIIGEGPDYSWVNNEIQRLDLENKVRIVGGISNFDIQSYFAMSDVFMMPSVIEEFGRVMLESMAMGVPIVCMQAIGPRAILTKKQQEFMVPQGDIALFAEKIALLLRETALRMQLINEGFERVKNFDKKIISKRFIEIVTS